MACQLCSSEHLFEMIRHEQSPLTNRYVRPHAIGDDYTFQLTLSQCRNCALIQLTTLPNTKESASQFDWITYREPEPHLDNVAERIMRLPGINQASTIMGITYKDDSLLDRLHSRIKCKIGRIDPAADLNLTIKNAGSEVILPLLTVDKAKTIANRHGLVDVVIARHILEHALDAQAFLETLQQLVRPGGYVVVELPDCRRSLDEFDYSMPWEEHVLYFTPQTFKNAFCKTPFSLIDFYLHPYAIENVMVAIVRFDRETQVAQDIEHNEFIRAEQYKAQFLKIKKQLHDFLQDKVRLGDKIAVFGAGHVSSMFINLMAIKPFISCVIDDDDNKMQLRMPGSLLPIHHSQKLLEENITLCLSGLSPESETKVREKQKTYFENGGKFISISAISSQLLTSPVQ